MQTDKYGQVSFDADEIFNALYSGKLKSFENVKLHNPLEVEQFNKSVSNNADSIENLQVYKNPQIDIELFDKTNQTNWFMPKDYCPDLIQQIYGMCKTEEQTERVSQELELFIQHGMLDLLYYLKYLVDTMRTNNVVWGLGRGSSVASYCLYLIGVHKIDPLKYKLDIREFIK